MTVDNCLVVTILGSGTSTGIPMPGCDCAVCQSDNPRNKRLRPSALIGWNGRNFLIDAGPDFRQQTLRARLSSIDAVLFTHAHADHILGIDDLRCFNFKQGAAIPCYGTAETLQQIARIFFYVFDRDPNYIGGGVSQLTLHPVQSNGDFQALDLPITAFPLNHGRLSVTGFKIGNFAYATDCHSIPEESEALLKDIDVLILDGLREKEHPTHMTIEQALQTGKRLGVKKLYLIHMSHAIDHDRISAHLPDWAELCYDGLQFSVPFP